MQTIAPTRPALVSLALTITTAHSFDGVAAAALERELTEAARWYGIVENPTHSDYALSKGKVLFARDWIDGQQVTTWALDRIPAETVRRCAGPLCRAWARIAAVHCGADAVIEFGGALVIGRAPAVEMEAA